MNNILYGYYFKNDKPSVCKSIKRIVPDSEMETRFDGEYEFYVDCFKQDFTDLSGQRWILVGVIKDADAEKGGQ